METSAQSTALRYLTAASAIAALLLSSSSGASEFENRMLRTIASVESNNGRNLDHRLVTAGLNAGTAAVGKFGIMPITILEVGNKTPSILRDYPRFATLTLREVPAFMRAHPELEERIARSHLRRLTKIFGDRPDVIGYAWLSGVGGARRALAAGYEFQAHWHVKKILTKLEQFGGWKRPAKPLDFTGLVSLSPRPRMLADQ